MTKHSLAVIVPTFNRGGRLLRTSLESIVNQTRRPDQVIVVNDGSTDGTQAQAEDILATAGYEWPYGRVLTNLQNQGKAASVNRALREVDADLVWIWDDDDVAALGRCEQLVPLFERDPEDQGRLGLVHTHAQYQEFEGLTVGAQWKPAHTPIDQVLRANLRGNIFFTISVMFRMELIHLLARMEDAQDRWTNSVMEGEFDWPMDPRLHRAQDFDLWMRLSWAMVRNGYRVHLHPEITVTAHTHEGNRGTGHNLTVDQVPQATLDAEKIIFRKMHERIPIDDIFRDYAGSPAVRQRAHLERAYGCAVRGLWDLVEVDLCYITKPGLLGDRSNQVLIRTLQEGLRHAPPGPQREACERELERIHDKMPGRAPDFVRLQGSRPPNGASTEPERN